MIYLICEKEVADYVINKISGNITFNVPKIIEARYKQHLFDK